jgi:esterase/lipase superfamily enzyme
MMNREYHRWQSDHLGHEMELLVFGQAGARVLIFPTRDGRFYDYENWGLVEALSEKIEQGDVQLFCVDSIDRESLYADWARPEDRMKRHLEFERYILDEVLPLTASLNPSPLLVAHGCSLGAYHAMNIGLKYPDRFGKIVALSGRYDLTKEIGSFRDLFDGFYDDQIYYNNPSHFIPRTEDEELLAHLRRMEIIFACGEEDAFLPNNIEFSDALTEKEIPHLFELWPGEAHKPRYWREMTAKYL